MQKRLQTAPIITISVSIGGEYYFHQQLTELLLLYKCMPQCHFEANLTLFTK